MNVKHTGGKSRPMFGAFGSVSVMEEEGGGEEKFPCCNYPQQCFCQGPTLISFYGSFRAGMQSLVISSHLIGHLQDGFWDSNSL